MENYNERNKELVTDENSDVNTDKNKTDENADVNLKEVDKFDDGEIVKDVGNEILWTKIDEFDGLFNGKRATFYDVNVTYQSNRVRAGVAMMENSILEFHLNIPSELQRQGIGSEIFKRAIEDYAPSKVKGWWKKLDIYSEGESINLIVFKQKIKDGLSPIDAAFETPTGKILKENGFDGTPEIIMNTNDEVIIYFNPK